MRKRVLEILLLVVAVAGVARVATFPNRPQSAAADLAQPASTANRASKVNKSGGSGYQGCLDEIRFDDVTRDGKPYGVRMTDIHSIACLTALGLRDRDIVLSFGQTKTLHTDDMAMCYRQHPASLTIERNGKVETISPP